jgi:hypothetical protein
MSNRHDHPVAAVENLSGEIVQPQKEASPFHRHMDSSLLLNGRSGSHGRVA